MTARRKRRAEADGWSKKGRRRQAAGRGASRAGGTYEGHERHRREAMARCEGALRAQRDEAYERRRLRREGEGREGRARGRGSRASKADGGGRRVQGGRVSGHRGAHRSGDCKGVARRCGRSWGPGRSGSSCAERLERLLALLFPRRGGGVSAGRKEPGVGRGTGRAGGFSHVRRCFSGWMRGWRGVL